MSNEDVEKLDRLREELGMNRSQYIRYVISGQKKIIPFPIREKKLIEAIAAVELDMSVIALKDGMESEDVIAIYSEIQEIKQLLVDKYNF